MPGAERHSRPRAERRCTSDQVLRDVFDIPGWGIAYVVGLSVLAEPAALFPLLTALPATGDPRPAVARMRVSRAVAVPSEM